MAALAVIGGFTAVFAGLVMMTQANVKRALGYSTVAQMGFMMLQCGLGAFSAAMLHIIAHSMGTRVTAQALARLSDFEDSPSFGHVVFAAGDLDTNLFEEWMGASSRLYDGVTIYTSRQDRAVGFSGWLRNLSRKMAFWGANNDVKRRIGFYEKKSAPSTFDLPSSTGEQVAKTIDISEAAKKSFLFKVRHSVYAESKLITDDIRYLFDHPFSDPSDRSTQFKRACPQDKHWTFLSEKKAARHRSKRCPDDS